jgi:hypothetical protein
MRQGDSKSTTGRIGNWSLYLPFVLRLDVGIFGFFRKEPETSTANSKTKGNIKKPTSKRSVLGIKFPASLYPID